MSGVTSAGGRHEDRAPSAALKDSRARPTGIAVIGDVPWGTHFCQFYQTRQDLVDVLVPYFKAGLENNEFCVWVTSEPLRTDEAKAALRAAVPDLDRYVQAGQIEVLDYTQWYTRSGEFRSDEVLRAWVDKLGEALQKGYEGLRLSGNTFWLEKADWAKFADYETAVNDVIGRYRMLAICTYSLDKCGSMEVIDIVKNHQFALVKREGRWETIESGEVKKAEEQKMHLASFPELNPNPIVELDAAGGIRYLNPAARRLFPDLLTRGTSHPLIAGLDPFAVRFQAGEASAVREVWVEGRCYHEAACLVEVMQSLRIYALDITGIKQSQEAFRQSEREFRTMFELSGVGQVQADPVTGRYIRVNRKVCQITGYEPEELLTKTYMDITHPEDRARDAEVVASVLLGERDAWSTEKRYIRKDGEVIWVSVHGTAFRDEAGKPLQTMAMILDITDRKRAEEALRKAHEELEARVQERTVDLSRTVGQLRETNVALEHRTVQLRKLAAEVTLAEQRERQRMANVLHDHLQQLLVGAQFWVGGLRRSRAKGAREAAREISDLIAQSIETSRTLTGELSPPTLQEGGLVPALEWLSGWMHQKHGLAVQLAVDEKAAPRSEDVSILLFQSVRELLLNVVKHANVKTARVQVGRSGELVQVVVQDEGVGFDPAHLRAAGGPSGGSGLFSIRERLDLLGGRLEIDSAPGRGSRFTLLAPMG
jgi:PAS domain S-box-containing protein